MQVSPTQPVTPLAVATNRPNAAQLMQKAQMLEAAFLSEMLGHAGVGGQENSFGGGIGEEQFASFLRQEQAELMVKRGGIGLAEQLFRAMGGEEK
ncbi:MAG: rod-binding protein [Paracoccaceae bacterium]